MKVSLLSVSLVLVTTVTSSAVVGRFADREGDIEVRGVYSTASHATTTKCTESTLGASAESSAQAVSIISSSLLPPDYGTPIASSFSGGAMSSVPSIGLPSYSYGASPIVFGTSSIPTISALKPTSFTSTAGDVLSSPTTSVTPLPGYPAAYSTPLPAGSYSNQAVVASASSLVPHHYTSTSIVLATITIANGVTVPPSATSSADGVFVASATTNNEDVSISTSFITISTSFFLAPTGTGSIPFSFTAPPAESIVLGSDNSTIALPSISTSFFTVSTSFFELTSTPTSSMPSFTFSLPGSIPTLTLSNPNSIAAAAPSTSEVISTATVSPLAAASSSSVLLISSSAVPTSVSSSILIVSSPAATVSSSLPSVVSSSPTSQNLLVSSSGQNFPADASSSGIVSLSSSALTSSVLLALTTTSSVVLSVSPFSSSFAPRSSASASASSNGEGAPSFQITSSAVQPSWSNVATAPGLSLHTNTLTSTTTITSYSSTFSITITTTVPISEVSTSTVAAIATSPSAILSSPIPFASQLLPSSLAISSASTLATIPFYSGSLPATLSSKPVLSASSVDASGGMSISNSAPIYLGHSSAAAALLTSAQATPDSSIPSSIGNKTSKLPLFTTYSALPIPIGTFFSYGTSSCAEAVTITITSVLTPEPVTMTTPPYSNSINGGVATSLSHPSPSLASSVQSSPAATSSLLSPFYSQSVELPTSMIAVGMTPSSSSTIAVVASTLFANSTSATPTSSLYYGHPPVGPSASASTTAAFTGGARKIKEQSSMMAALAGIVGLVMLV